MCLNLFKIYILLNIILEIISSENFQILSNTGEKGVAITSFTKDLYILSSTYFYNIINQNYHIIKNNSNNNNAGSKTPFYKNFEMLEASININTNESVLLIAENLGLNKKINLYSFNITSPLNDENPKLIYSINSMSSESRISLINTRNDRYLLSYILIDTKFESIWFEYTYYEGFEILKTFTINANIVSGMSCFLLYEQFPICFYATKENDNKYHLNIIVYDIIFINGDLYHRSDRNIAEIGIINDKILFTKAIYLSKDHAVFCFMDDSSKLFCDIIKLTLNFETLDITLSNSFRTNIFNQNNCLKDINKLDILKITEDKFIVGFVNNANKIIINLIFVDNTHNNIINNAYTIDKNVKSTLTLFLHEVNLNNNYYGIIFDDMNNNRLTYAYLNIPSCSKKSNKEPFQINLEEENNEFKFSEYLDITIDNNIMSVNDNNEYQIISFSANDDEKIFLIIK